jgi:hypothetical protein
MVTSKPLPKQAARYLAKEAVTDRLIEILFQAVDGEHREAFSAMTRTEKKRLLYSMGADVITE